jgi:hypothetical protein
MNKVLTVLTASLLLMVGPSWLLVSAQEAKPQSNIKTTTITANDVAVSCRNGSPQVKTLEDGVFIISCTQAGKKDPLGILDDAKVSKTVDDLAKKYGGTKYSPNNPFVDQNGKPKCQYPDPVTPNCTPTVEYFLKKYPPKIDFTPIKR